MTAVVPQVDALLSAARQTLGSGAGPTNWATPQIGSTVAPPAGWQGDASKDASTVSNRLDARREELLRAREAVTRLVGEAAGISRDAHAAVNTVEAAWAQDKAALAPLSKSPEGQSALIQAGILRLGEANDVIRNAATRFAQAAQRIPDIPTTDAFEPVVNPIPPPEGGYVTIWCSPDGRGLGFLCEYLWPDGRLSTYWSQWDLTGGRPI